MSIAPQSDWRQPKPCAKAQPIDSPRWKAHGRFQLFAQLFDQPQQQQQPDRGGPCRRTALGSSSSINYRRKLYQRPIYLGFIFSPSYSIYHRSQFDLINLSYSPYLTFKWKGVDFSATVTRSEMESLATEAAVNSSDSFTGDISGSFRMRALLPWLGNAEQRRLASSSWRLTFNARRFESATSPIFSSLNRSLSATLNQTLGNGWRWTEDTISSTTTPWND